MKTAAACITITAAVLAGGPSLGAVSPAQARAVVTVTLPQGSSQTGEPGTATLAQRGANVLLTIKEPTLGHVTRAARIFKGTCAAPSRSTAYQLAPVVNGTSQSTLKGTTVDKLVHGGYALAISGAPSICGELSLVNPVPAPSPAGQHQPRH